MKTFIAFFCALCVANSVFADSYSEAIKQAKNASAKVTNAEQGNPSPSTPSPAAPPQTSPQPDPVLEATLRNIANLRADFAALGN
jgi:predicted RNase H-like HicB family nuclease